MPEAPERENPEQTATAAEELPEKFKGKSAAEIARMYEELEATFGRQGQELGELRAYVQALQSALPEREPATKDEYGIGEFAGDLIVAPEEVLPKVAQKIEERVAERVARVVQSQLTTQQRIEAWFRANPDLDQFREIVSVIGERVYQANPKLSIEQVLEITGREARAYIASLRPRLLGEDKESRKKAGITTSGGGRAREAGAEEQEREEASGLNPDQQAVMDEIRRIRDFRAKRMQPPRARG